MKIIIDGKNISKEQIEQWRMKRYIKVLKVLRKNIKFIDNVDDITKKITEIKMKYSYNEIVELLSNKLWISEKFMKIICNISRNKRKFSVTEIEMKGISAKEIITGIDLLMLTQSKENNEVNLAACPDHYVLRPTGENTLEVIETTGNSPLPVQFFIDYGDDSGIQTPRDKSYEYQSVGIARLKNGTLLGGVRHQFKEEDNGFKAKLVVEFPSMCPTSLIKEHQMHLACEFSYWFNWIKDLKTKK